MANKILIVDDDSDTLGLYRRMLELAGFEVFEAYDGAEGLALAKSCHPDIITTDELMPNVNGLDFLRRLREEGIKVPVIIIAGQVAHRREELLTLGFAEVLGKPVHMGNDCIPTINRLLGNPIPSVLIINQEMPLRYSLAQALETRHVRVSVATSYNRCIELIREYHIDLILVITGSYHESTMLLERLSNDGINQPIMALIVSAVTTSEHLVELGYTMATKYSPGENDQQIVDLISRFLTGN